jgi:hypothetical protein
LLDEVAAFRGEMIRRAGPTSRTLSTLPQASVLFI